MLPPNIVSKAPLAGFPCSAAQQLWSLQHPLASAAMMAQHHLAKVQRKLGALQAGSADAVAFQELQSLVL
jgi:hypothetical protein